MTSSDCSEVRQDDFAAVRGIVSGAGGTLGSYLCRRLVTLGARPLALVRCEDVRLSFPGHENVQTAAWNCDQFKGAEEELAAAVASYNARGPLSFLINCIGVGGWWPLHETPLGSWRSVLRTNLEAAFLLTKVVLPQMCKQGRGIVVHISSPAAKSCKPLASAYAASKAGLEALCKCADREARPVGVRVIAVSPSTEIGGPFLAASIKRSAPSLIGSTDPSTALAEPIGVKPFVESVLSTVATSLMAE